MTSSSQQAALELEKTIYVTRHMQKLDGADPSLSPEGAAAAEALADFLVDRGISKIFATQTRRAMETAAPLAKLIGVKVTAYDPRNSQQLAIEVAASKGSVLVIGHSNTVHDLVQRFGGKTPPAPLSEQDYGAVFVINPRGDVTVFEVGRI